MVLCGVGGRTIAEAKRNISYEEWLIWRAYIKKHGLPALGSEATERAFALLTWRVDRAAGGKSELKDWLPKQPEEERFATPQDILMILAGKKGKTNG